MSSKRVAEKSKAELTGNHTDGKRAFYFTARERGDPAVGKVQVADYGYNYSVSCVLPTCGEEWALT